MQLTQSYQHLFAMLSVPGLNHVNSLFDRFESLKKSGNLHVDN